MNKFIYDLPESEYFSFDAVNNSTLNRYEKSALHGKHLSTSMEQSEPTPEMILGSATHTMALEGVAEFEERYAVLPPDIDRRTKTGKAIYQELLSTGKTVISYDNYCKAVNMTNAIFANDWCNELLSSGKSEVTAIWRDKATDLLMKCRFDSVVEEAGVIIDIKTTKDASPAEFARSVMNFRYHRQASMYSAGYEAVKGDSPYAFYFIAVETSAPHGVAIYRLSDHALYVGEHEWQQLAIRYKEAIENNDYKGYDKTPQVIDLPSYYKVFHDY